MFEAHDSFRGLNRLNQPMQVKRVDSHPLTRPPSSPQRIRGNMPCTAHIRRYRKWAKMISLPDMENRAGRRLSSRISHTFPVEAGGQSIPD
jgi:hypothetical protein